MSAATVRRALLSSNARSIRHRRTLAALAAASAVDAAAVALAQMKVIPHLPDPPGKLFDSDAVVRSKPAYLFRTPDASLGLLLNAAEIALAGAGGAKRSRLLDVALAGSVAAGALAGLGYLADMVFREKKACMYCLTSLGLSLAMVPVAWRLVKRR